MQEQQGGQPKYLQETQRQKMAREEKERKQQEGEEKQFVLLNTRMLDNHWDKNLHQQNHWRALGRQPESKYDYTKDQGLGYRIDNKFEQQIKEEREELAKKKQGSSKNFHDGKNVKMRPYKELDNINDDEIVITIEYCTNCSQHNSTTRHDEQKYLNQALSLQKEILKSFPIVTVFLKPNVYDERDKSVDTLYIRQRLGAFDVQIAAGQIDGPTRKGVLHSKLKSGKWPDHASILSQIRKYMNTTSILVNLNLQDFNIDDVDPEQFRNPKINKLYDIEVILRPKREKVTYKGGVDVNEQQQTIGKDGNSRPVSAMSRKSAASRPKSAASIKSRQSQSQFGGSGAVQEYDTSKDKIVKKTEPDGTVLFDDVPYDCYYIEIEETNEFKLLKETVDIFEYVKNDEPVDLFYELKHLGLTFLKLMCTWGYPATEEEQKAMKSIVGQNKDQAPLVSRGPLDKAQLEVIPIRDGEEIVEETYDDIFNGTNEITLLPGKQYQIRISKTNYQTLDQRVELQPGAQELEFCVEKEAETESQKSRRTQSRAASSQQRDYPSQQQQQQQQGQAQNQNRPGSGKDRPVSAAKILQIFTYDGSADDNAPIQGASVVIKEKKMDRRNNDQVYKTDANGQCQIQLQNILEGSLEITHPDYITMSEPYGPQKFDLNRQKEINFPLMRKTSPGELSIRVLTNSGQKILSLNVVNPNDQIIDGPSADIDMDNSFENGSGYLTIKNINKLNGIYRIYANLYQPDSINPSVVKVFALYNNQQYCIDVPRNISTENGKPNYWDIGFIYAPTCEFIEINAPCQNQVGKDTHIGTYKKFLSQIQSSKVDLKQLLGFNQEQKLQIDDDVLQQFSQIAQSLENYGFEPNNSLVHLFASAKQQNGMYSFQKLKAKFSSVTSQSGWDVEEENYDDDEDYKQI